MEIFGVPVSEDTVKNTAVSGAVLLGLWQFVLKQLPWKSWLEKLLARFVPQSKTTLVPRPVVDDTSKPTADDAAVNDALYTLRLRLKGDAQGQALVDGLSAYWWKRDCQPEQAK